MVNFTKMHGLGNDFILINLFTEEAFDYQKVARKWCHRQLGIGGDGVVLICPPRKAENDLRMIIYNSDGSEADMCGNALRCFAKYVYEKNLVHKAEFRVETKAGVMIPQVQLDDTNVSAVRVNMGKPLFSPPDIPIQLSGKEVINQKIEVGGAIYHINALFLGNPHCVIYTDDLTEFPVDDLGPAIENDPLFPKKVNVEFVKVLNRNTIKVRVWERGAGLTLACGTGACAAVVASVKNNLTDTSVEVQQPGGNLYIELITDLVYMTGPAEYVYTGRIES